VRQQTPRQRLFARPDDVAGEVVEAVFAQLGGDPGIDLWTFAGQHQQLLCPMAFGRIVKDPLHLLRSVQMRPVRRERAVLAVATARTRERQRKVAAERDAATHSPTRFYESRIVARRMRVLVIVLVGTLTLLAGGCGAARTPAALNATLVLDFTPNAVHAGIYSAIAHHFDAAEGVRLHLVVPSASTDSIRLLESGRANFAILDIHDLALARARGEPIIGIMAVVERPLAAVIAAPQIRGPRQLEGKTVGVTGVASDTAVLSSVVSGAGGDPRKVRTVTIGFDAVPALLAGRVAAATAFWNDEGVTLQRRRPGFHVFRVDAYGAPSYPELVLCATRSSLSRDPALARALVRALVRGYGVTLADPRRSAADLEAQVTGLDPNLVASELAVEEPAFRAADGRFGELDQAALRRWARWEVRFGIVSRLPDVARMFDPEFLPATAYPSGH
jgi:putative hydroxymethylpyrimidine transport system substrate-binding protein